MSLYDYHCSGCGGDFEKIVTLDTKNLVLCPSCGSRAFRRVSRFTFKVDNPFTKDGEGFTSINMSKQEAKERAKANAGKYD